MFFIFVEADECTNTISLNKKSVFENYSTNIFQRSAIFQFTNTIPEVTKLTIPENQFHYSP